MADERALLIQQVLDLQARLCRSLRSPQEWLAVDLTMSQLKVLFLVYAWGAASMSQLAASLGVTLSTVTGIVDRLVEHGLLQREEDPHDRRFIRCQLTAQGAATVERLHQANYSQLAQVLAGLSLSDLRAVAAALAVLCAAAQRTSESVAPRPLARWAPGAASAL